MAYSRGVRFAPIPTQAKSDRQLTASHWRVLAAIAEHDRLSGPLGRGGGCWASHRTLSKESNVNYNNLSTCIHQLLEWGYIERGVRPNDKRKHVYRVIYAENSSPLGEPVSKISSSVGELSGGNKNLSSDPKPPEAPSHSNEQPSEILRGRESQLTDNAELSSNKYIPLNGSRLLKPANAVESLELAVSDRRTKRTSPHDDQFLTLIEAELGSGRCGLDNTTSAEIRRMIGDPGCDEDHRRRAQRVLDLYGSSSAILKEGF